MAAANPAGRIAVWALGLLVLALGLSWAYASYWPERNTHRPAMGAAAKPGHRVIRVQVWNGSGEGGIGAKVASYLREGGFHVVEVKNADRMDYFATLVVARRDDPSAAEAVSRYLGGPPVIRQAWSSDVAEVTVVLGSDRSRLHIGD